MESLVTGLLGTALGPSRHKLKGLPTGALSSSAVTGLELQGV